MMRRQGQTTSFQERVQIAEGVKQGQTNTEIAAQLGCSPFTVRKWRRRYQKQGRPGLSSVMGRPSTGALGSFSAELREAIRHLRQQHPGWGPNTLLIELHNDPRWAREKLPSRSRVAAFLKQEGLTRPYFRHTELPMAQPDDLEHPHQLWQLDAKGWARVDGIGVVSVINIIDVVSRTKIESCPRVAVRKPSTEDYFLTLRRAFMNYGLPAYLSLDRDAVFLDNTHPSPYPTRIHLWLIALGIEVTFIRQNQPTDHGVIERHHQTMAAQTMTGQTWSSEMALWQGLDQRRDILNDQFPMKILGGLSPFEAYPQAKTNPRSYHPTWEHNLLSLEHVYTYLGQGRWFRYCHHGHIHLGGYQYYFSYHFHRQTIEVTFDPIQRSFVFQPEGDRDPIAVPAQGLSKADLMGDLAALLNLPTHQLPLPFSAHDWRQLDLVALLEDTT